MPQSIYELSLDVLGAYDRLDALAAEPPRDPSRYDLARRRAAEVFDAFEASPEMATLDEGARWTQLFLRTAYVQHAVTIDELTPEVVLDVASRFVGPNDMSSLAHWTEVMHPELVAFFCFLCRKGFRHAPGCVQVLEEIVLPEMDARMKAASYASADAAHIVMPGSGVFQRHGTGTLSPVNRRARRKAQRAARRRNR